MLKCDRFHHILSVHRSYFLFLVLQFQLLYKDISCVIFHDVDLIPLDLRNIYGCSMEGPRHLSANLQQFRYLLPYENLFGGVVAISCTLFESVNGFSNEYFGKYNNKSFNIYGDILQTAPLCEVYNNLS